MGESDRIRSWVVIGLVTCVVRVCFVLATEPTSNPLQLLGQLFFDYCAPSKIRLKKKGCEHSKGSRGKITQEPRRVIFWSGLKPVCHIAAPHCMSTDGDFYGRQTDREHSKSDILSMYFRLAALHTNLGFRCDITLLISYRA